MNLGTSKGLLFGIQACNINGVFGVKWERWRQKGNEVTVNTQRSVSIYFKLRGIVWQSCARKDSELSDFQSFTSKIRFILHIFFMELISYCSIWNFGFWSNLILPSLTLLDVKSHELTSSWKSKRMGSRGRLPGLKYVEGMLRLYHAALCLAPESSCTAIVIPIAVLRARLRLPNDSIRLPFEPTLMVCCSFQTFNLPILETERQNPLALSLRLWRTLLAKRKWVRHAGGWLVKLSQPLLHPAPAFA